MSQARLTTREARLEFESDRRDAQQRSGQRSSAVFCPCRFCLRLECLSIRYIMPRQQITFASTSASKGRSDALGNIIDIGYGEAAARMPRDMSLSNFEHRIAKRVRKLTWAIQHSGINNNDPDSEMCYFERLHFGKPLTFVVQQTQWNEIVHSALTYRLAVRAVADGRYRRYVK